MAQSQRRRTNQGRLANESALEFRVLPAGNVTVTQDNHGDFVILGDKNANILDVIQTPEGVQLIGTGTLINGSTAPYQLSFSVVVTASLKINLQGGNDRFSMNNIQVTGAVFVAPSAGNDRTEIIGCQILPVNETHSSLRIGVPLFSNDKVKDDAGDDVCIVRNSILRGINGSQGAGSDIFLMFGDVITNTGVSMSQGSGNDYLGLSQVTMSDPILGGLQFEMGSGNDMVKLLQVDLAYAYELNPGGASGAGTDLIYVDSIQTRRTDTPSVFALEGSSDRVTVLNSTFAGFVHLGAGTFYGTKPEAGNHFNFPSGSGYLLHSAEANAPQSLLVSDPFIKKYFASMLAKVATLS